MRHRPVICILDDNRERCLRAEIALDAAIRAKKLPVSGISNFGSNHLARTGLDSFPAIEVDGVYFTPKNPGQMLDFEVLCDFLDMLVRRGIIGGPEDDAV